MEEFIITELCKTKMTEEKWKNFILEEINKKAIGHLLSDPKAKNGNIVITMFQDEMKIWLENDELPSNECYKEKLHDIITANLEDAYRLAYIELHKDEDFEPTEQDAMLANISINTKKFLKELGDKLNKYKKGEK